MSGKITARLGQALIRPERYCPNQDSSISDSAPENSESAPHDLLRRSKRDAWCDISVTDMK